MHLFLTKKGGGKRQVKEAGEEKNMRAGRNNQLFPDWKVRDRSRKTKGCTLPSFQIWLKSFEKKKRDQFSRRRRSGKEVKSTIGLCGSGLA